MIEMKHKIVYGILALAVLSLLLLSGCGPSRNPTKEKSCTDAGGTVITASCCKTVSSFPNTCNIGACGCSPANSHTVYTCQCPQGKCFDGDYCRTLCPEGNLC